MTNQYKEWVSGVFSRAAPQYGEEHCPYFEYFAHKLVKQANVKAGSSVLDIACGKGAVLFELVKQWGTDIEVTGVDLSSEMVRHLQKKLEKSKIYHTQVMQMDAEHLKFNENHFDYAFVSFALFFFPHLSKALKEAQRVLKKGACFGATIFESLPELTLDIVTQAQKITDADSFSASPIKGAQYFKQLLDPYFENINIAEESHTFWYSSPEMWWESLWVQGTRSYLERLPKQACESLKAYALKQANKIREIRGIPQRYAVFICTANSRTS